MARREIACVYTITNATTGECYVGSTKYLPRRKSMHLHDLRKHRHSSSLLQSAVDAYGLHKFAFNVIETLGQYDKATLHALEDQWIAKLRPAYNMPPGKSPETRARMSEAAKLRDSAPYRGNQNAAGAKWTDERRANFTAHHKGQKRTPEQAARIAAGTKAAWARRKQLIAA